MGACIINVQLPPCRSLNIHSVVAINAAITAAFTISSYEASRAKGHSAEIDGQEVCMDSNAENAIWI